jgi:glyoxalase family protein
MTAELGGLHHVTAITGNAPGNVEFYTHVLGMRLVKKTVNQDDVSAYHLFYADRTGNPGTDVTFFDWPFAVPNQAGVPEIAPITLRVPEGSLDWWGARLDELQVRHSTSDGRLAFTDPEGQRLELAGHDGATRFDPWPESPVAPEHQIRGLHAVRLASADPQRTADLLSHVMGFRPAAEKELAGGDRLHTFELEGKDSGSEVSLLLPKEPRRSRQGRGGVHHVAFRVKDEVEQEEWRERVLATGLQPTPIIDRFYFKSVYFREPGGNLFELATDGPGFTADESDSELGHHLALPPFLEPRREQIEAGLTPLPT